MLSLSRCIHSFSIAVLYVATAATAAEPERSIQFNFPDQNLAQELLAQEDLYTATASAFDRKVRMGTDTDPGTSRYLKFVTAQALPWQPKQRTTVQKSILALQLPLKSLAIRLKSPVNLIHTTGKEESGAAYTRGNEIIFPSQELKSEKRPPTKLLAHELFHVISRQHPILRDELYQLIGFEKANPIRLPTNISHLRITNPDAPVIEHVMQLKLSPTQTVHVAPMLIANSDFKTDGPSSLFAYLSFQLMQVQKTPGGWVPELDNGSPIYHSPNTADFQRQIGRNTGYIIHPEEILADNFSLVLTNGKIVDQWLTDRMTIVIKKYFENLDARQ